MAFLAPTQQRVAATIVSSCCVQDVLDLIEKKPLGVLDTLDEACRFPQATGATFADKMYTNKDIMAHKRFEKPKRSNTAFIIDHYAGKVEYQVDHFLEKNKDFVVKEHQDLLAASSLPLVARAPPSPFFRTQTTRARTTAWQSTKAWYRSWRPNADPVMGTPLRSLGYPSHAVPLYLVCSWLDDCSMATLAVVPQPAPSGHCAVASASGQHNHHVLRTWLMRAKAQVLSEVMPSRRTRHAECISGLQPIAL